MIKDILFIIIGAICIGIAFVYPCVIIRMIQKKRRKKFIPHLCKGYYRCLDRESDLAQKDCLRCVKIDNLYIRR